MTRVELYHVSNTDDLHPSTADAYMMCNHCRASVPGKTKWLLPMRGSKYLESTSDSDVGYLFSRSEKERELKRNQWCTFTV